MFIHEFLIDLRRKDGLTQAEMSSRMHMSPVTWNGPKQGRSLPRLTSLVKIGEALGFEVAIHTSDRPFVLVLRNGKVHLESWATSKATTRHLSKLFGSLSPAQIKIAVKVAKMSLSDKPDK
jgi:transcriptional regulator with XRE-family HTH domain